MGPKSKQTNKMPTKKTRKVKELRATYRVLSSRAETISKSYIRGWYIDDPYAGGEGVCFAIEEKGNKTRELIITRKALENFMSSLPLPKKSKKQKS